MALDYLAARGNFVFSGSKWQADFARTSLGGAALGFLKPLTFMNLSGVAVSACAGFYKIPPERILVIHDDLDLPGGRIKIVARGGAGGHNGIRSIIERLGTNDFARIKIGIGRPENSIPADRYVLTNFTVAERLLLAERLALVEEGVRLFVAGGVAAAMNHVNTVG